MSAGGVDLETFRGPAGEFHAADLLAARRLRVVVGSATGPALVLGSRQHADVVDREACQRALVDVVKRRSGGGVVLVEPGSMCWFDVVVPVDDPRFESVAADVGASMRWLGRRIATALGGLGVGRATIHDGPMAGGPWADLICFAGCGPGEVLVDGDKLVGISQRRTRHGSRFQCMAHIRWSPDVLIGLLADPRPDVDVLPPVGVLPADVADALPGAVARGLTAAR